MLFCYSEKMSFANLFLTATGRQWPVLIVLLLAPDEQLGGLSGVFKMGQSLHGLDLRHVDECQHAAPGPGS